MHTLFRLFLCKTGSCHKIYHKKLAPVNYVKRARARRLARLEEERQLYLMRGKCPTHPKSTDLDRADEENVELIVACFCGDCAPSGAFSANTDSS